MLSRYSSKLIWGMVVFGIIGAARAQFPPDPSRSYATYVDYPQRRSVMLMPDGTGTPLNACYIHGVGPSGDATITMTLLGSAGLPVPGFPARDIWLQSSLGGLSWCGYSRPPGSWPGYVNIADADTDVHGETTFSSAPFGGGHTRPPAGERLEVWINGPGGPCKISGTAPGGPPNSDLDIQCNSPDINGDLVVDLSDVIIFAMDMRSGVYRYRSDLFWSSACDLSDLVIFSGSFGAICP